MAARKVIVFGPTGAVGSAAARTAASLGAEVTLAMRDTAKVIPGLDDEKEKNGAFERTQADLTNPDTVRDAVSKSGAKYAFIYLAFGMPDNMKSTIEALKSAGIELVVFLSSFTVRGDLRAIEPSDIIPYVHAQVELNLEEIFGADGFVAVRPGSFASNNLPYKEAIEKGEVKLWVPDAKLDNIVPEDIGRVCGTVLAKGSQDDQRVVYLYGPTLSTQSDTIKTLAEALGKDPKMTKADEQEAYKMFTEERGMPPHLANYMIRQARKAAPEGSEYHVFGTPIEEEHMSNVQKYTGQRATSLEEWAQQAFATS